MVFDNWFSKLLPGVAKGDYWVLYLGDGYKTAVVGNPDRTWRVDQVSQSMAMLRTAHEAVGGDVISAGGTGTYTGYAVQTAGVTVGAPN